MTPEEEKLLAEAEKLRAEAAALRENVRTKPTTWANAARTLLSSLIGAVLGAAAFWQFGIDASITLNQLNEETHEALQLKQTETSKKLNQANQKLEEAIEREKLAHLRLKEAEARELEVSAERDQLQIEKDSWALRANPDQTQDHSTVPSIEDQSADSSGSKNWFAVIASAYNLQDTRGRLKQIEQLNRDHPVEVYRASDSKGTPLYAITLGGYLEKAIAQERVSYARLNDISDDAFLWQTDRWGNDILSQIRQAENQNVGSQPKLVFDGHWAKEKYQLSLSSTVLLKVDQVDDNSAGIRVSKETDDAVLLEQTRYLQVGEITGVTFGDESFYITLIKIDNAGYGKSQAAFFKVEALNLSKDST